MAPSESGGDQLYLTEYRRNFAKMNVVGRFGNTRDVRRHGFWLLMK